MTISISGSDAMNTVFDAIKAIAWRQMPHLYVVEMKMDKEGRVQRHEARQINYVYEGESESKYVLGARQIRLTMLIGYPIATDLSDGGEFLWVFNDQNQIKQTLLTLDVSGIIQADAGESTENYGISGESAKVIQIPLTIDYMPPETEGVF